MNTVHLTKELWGAEEMARNLFLDDPDLSIDDAARQLDSMTDRTLGKDVLSQIRREVREHINRSMGAGTPRPIVNLPATARKDTKFANHPRLAEDKNLKVVPGTSVASVDDYQKGAEMDGKNMARRPQVDSGEKKKWFENWALENPWSTIKEGRAAITAQFGEGLGTDFIADTLKTARKLTQEAASAAREAQNVPQANAPQPIAKEGSGPVLMGLPSLGDGLKSIVAIMKEHGIRTVTINKDGSVDMGMNEGLA
jgi:hypothetical protein